MTEVNDDVTYAFGKRFVLGRHRGGAALDQTLFAVDAVHTAVDRQLTAATTTIRDVTADKTPWQYIHACTYWETDFKASHVTNIA